LADWSEAADAQLRKLYGDGLSASQIAAEIGGGVTRNAVIGKVHRLGLSGRPKPVSSNKGGWKKRRAWKPPVRVGAAAKGGPDLIPVEPKEPTVELAIPIEERKTILQLTEHTCRWPIGDVGDEDFHFCGRQPKPGLVYCEHHARRAYESVSVRRQRREAGAAA
jgi:GcrA cell cycle regulator